MMDDDRTQPELDYVLQKANEYAPQIGYQDKMWYEFGCGHGYTQHESQLRKPSYNLKLYYGNILILEACYELDVRFSIDVRVEEIERIEELLATRTIAVLALNGLGNLLRFKTGQGYTPNTTIKESDDKAQFMSLN